MHKDCRIKVVVIDDLDDQREVMQIMLGDSFEVACCSSCSEAIQFLTSNRADVLLIDIGMHEIDGMECLRQIRALPEHTGTPALAVTAYAYPQDRERCLKAGFSDFISKPVVDFAFVESLIRKAAESTAAD
jgi:CheY-like chemotaxis protein